MRYSDADKANKVICDLIHHHNSIVDTSLFRVSEVFIVHQGTPV